MPKRENLRRIDEHVTHSVTIQTGDNAMGVGPATCSVSSTNAATALSHTHEITTCDDGTVYPAILASMSNGDLEMGTCGVWAYQVTADVLEADTSLVIAGNVTSDLRYEESLKAIRGGSTYTVYPMVFLTTALTSTDWNVDYKTSANNGTLDLSVVFGAPAGIKAALVLMSAGGMTDADYIWFGRDSASPQAMAMLGTVSAYDNGIIPCDSNGDIYVTVSGTVGVSLKILGYAI